MRTLPIGRRRQATARAKKRPAGRWIDAEPNPAQPDTLDDFRFFAVLGTWMEEDVVEATVANAFAQGVEAVYLVDNASTDATVERAVAAGATLAESYRTARYEERVRILFMNGTVARVSLASGAEHVWWLWLDADEFPEGPDGLTILDYLRGLDRRFRIVGSTYYNHFPDSKPEYLRGFHPVDLQPLCAEFAPEHQRNCLQPHWKHPLQRFDLHEGFILSILGFHTAGLHLGAPLSEPEGGVVTHHVQYRDEVLTRQRMERLCGGPARNAYNDSVGHKSIQRRFDTLDAVYAHRWADVDHLGAVDGRVGVTPEPWPDVDRLHRWYERSDLEAAIAASRPSTPSEAADA